MGQYFSNENLQSNMQTYKTSLFGNALEFTTDNGVFSKKSLDFGTRLLLDTISKFDIDGPVLDVGCGYGPIGISVAKRYNTLVTMVDVNKRALHLSKMNAIKNDVASLLTIVESNAYENIAKDSIFKTIITNPPIRAGKTVVYDIVMNARNYMDSSSNLFIVIRKEQGAKSMIRDLNEYYEVEVLNKDKGYFILKCKTR